MAGGGKQKWKTQQRKQRQSERRVQDAHLRLAVALGVAPTVDAARAMSPFDLRRQMGIARRQRRRAFAPSIDQTLFGRNIPAASLGAAMSVAAMEQCLESWERQDLAREMDAVRARLDQAWQAVRAAEIAGR